MSYARWLVAATRQGQYDQILREPGEVFELLGEEDGTYAPAVRLVPRRNADGRPVLDELGEAIIDEAPVQGADGLPLHQDFAEDLGATQLTRGPMRGEVMHLGWMLRVPDSTPCGLYPAGTDFWSGAEPPPHRKAVAVAPKPAPTPRAASQAAPIRGSRNRPAREAP